MEAVSPAAEYHTQSEHDQEEVKGFELPAAEDEKITEKTEPHQIMNNSSKAGSSSDSTAMNASKVSQVTPEPKIDFSGQIQSE